ncbi:MAG: hypothetical protein P8Z49_05085 [Acidobacteriota bacterium]
MEDMLSFAKGPLFALTFLFMALGLARHVLLQVRMLATKGRTLRRVHWRRVFADSLSWAFPYGHLARGTLMLTLVSIIFHAGAIIVPLFLGGHIVLWEGFLGLELPSIGQNAADGLTLSTILCLSILLFYRIVVPRAALSRAEPPRGLQPACADPSSIRHRLPGFASGLEPGSMEHHDASSYPER